MSDRGNAVIQEPARYKKMKLICILEGACLETVKTKKVSIKRLLIRMQGFTLLNSDDHQGLHKKMNLDPVNSRPDICHQVLIVYFCNSVEFTCFA